MRTIVSMVKFYKLFLTRVRVGFMFWNKDNEGLPWWLGGRESACQYRRCGIDPWVGKSPWKRKWQPTLYSCLGNPVDRGAWQATVLGVARVRHNLATNNDRTMKCWIKVVRLLNKNILVWVSKYLIFST